MKCEHRSHPRKGREMKDWIMELCPEITEWQAEIIAEQVRIRVESEREACAKACEETTASWTQHLYNEGVMDCVKAIRARGEK